MAPDQSYSRVVEYLVDEVSMQVSQVWEYRPEGDERLYSGSRGDADQLVETGNSLMTFSAVSHVGGATSESLALGRRHVRVIEADHNAQPNEVFDLQLHMSGGVAGITVYRADRIASLYASTVITYRVEIFSGGFESGDVSVWSVVVP